MYFYSFTCTSAAAQMVSALGATQFGLSVSSTCDGENVKTSSMSGRGGGGVGGGGVRRR